MNGGTNRGQAYGARFEILVLSISTLTCICKLSTSAKTANIKQSFGTKFLVSCNETATRRRSCRHKGATLLHYIAHHLQQRNPDALVFFETCTDVWLGAKVLSFFPFFCVRDDVVVLFRSP